MGKEKIIGIILIPIFLFLFGVYNIYPCFYREGAVIASHIPYWKCLFWVSIIGTIIDTNLLLFNYVILKQLRWIIGMCIPFWILYLFWRIFVEFYTEEVIIDILYNMKYSVVMLSIILVIIILMIAPYEHRTRNKSNKN